MSCDEIDQLNGAQVCRKRAADERWQAAAARKRKLDYDFDILFEFNIMRT